MLPLASFLSASALHQRAASSPRVQSTLEQEEKRTRARAAETITIRLEKNACTLGGGSELGVDYRGRMPAPTRGHSGHNDGDSRGSTSRLTLEAAALLDLPSPSARSSGPLVKRRNRTGANSRTLLASIVLANLSPAFAQSPPDSFTAQRTASHPSSAQLTALSAAPNFDNPDSHLPTPAPIPPPRPRVRKRDHLDQVPPRFRLLEGDLIPDDEWQLFGKSSTAKHFIDVVSSPPRTDTDIHPALLEANSEPTVASALPITITVPDGWQNTPRPTSFYAVPVIVASSLILALFIIGGILSGIVWRSKQRVRRHIEDGDGALEQKRSKLDRLFGRKGKKYKSRRRRVVQREMTQEGGDAVSIVSVRSATEFAVGGAGRVRQRRARNRRATAEDIDSQDNDDGEETRPLTGSATSLSAAPTLAGRIVARLRPSTAESVEQRDSNRLDPSIVFSRDLPRSVTTSSDASHSSRTAQLPLPLPSAAPPVSPPILAISTTALTVSLPSESSPPSPGGQSNFGLTFPTETVVQPSPPAYRQNRTIPSSSRLNPITLPPAAITLRTGEPSEWADEKVEARSVEEEVQESVVAQQEEEEEVIDPATYSAHIATDDKVVLARLRATSSLSSDRNSPLEMPSAPQLDSNDIDEDGFERLVLPVPTGSTSSLVLPNLMPPPSTPLSPTFSYSSPSPVTPAVTSNSKGKEAARDGEVEVLDLPIYRNGVDPMAAASAPPPEVDDDDQDDEARGGVV